MKKAKLLIALGVMFMLLSITATFAQEAASKMDKKDGNWVLLGSHVVDYTLDRDVVDLEDSNNMYTGLKFKVINGPINLHKCTIHFEGGETQDVSFSESATTSQTVTTNDGRQIDLYGNTRKIEKITFWYDTKNSSEKKAVVEVWGKK